MDKRKRIVVASGNAHKITEIADILKDFEFVSMKDAGFEGDIVEDGASFKENALIKAKTVAEALNMTALADDSGLCVDALGGAPGIYSARFSGEGDEGNRRLLLKQLEGIDDRRAHFECAVCLYSPGGRMLFGVGKTYGHILHEERGDNGFGYDCLFYSDDLKMSFGEATEEQKNGVSHRARALKDLENAL